MSVLTKFQQEEEKKIVLFYLIYIYSQILYFCLQKQSVL